MKFEKGMTLVEVLVAAVILALGLIGLAMLQMQGLRATRIAFNGLDASVMANQLAEQIRLNADNAASYVGLSSTDCSGGSPYATQILDDYCTVYDDLVGQHRAHSSNQPVAVTCTDCTGTSPRYRVTVSWSEMGSSGSAEDSTYAMDFILSEY